MHQFFHKWAFRVRVLWVGILIGGGFIFSRLDDIWAQLALVVLVFSVILTSGFLMIDWRVHWEKPLADLFEQWAQGGTVPDSLLESRDSELLVRWSFYRRQLFARYEEWEARLTSLENLTRDQLDAQRKANASLKELDERLNEAGVESTLTQGEEGAGNGIPQETIDLEVAQLIDQLEGTIAMIDQVLVTVEGMTRQPQLLSLNAVIEAAKSGDEGRRFSEMAVEIREMSTEAMATSKRVTEIMSGLNDTLKSLLIGARQPGSVPAHSNNDEELRMGAALTGEKQTISVKTAHVREAQTLMAHQERLGLVMLKRLVAMRLDLQSLQVSIPSVGVDEEGLK